jgi:uncharacterized protein (TIGR00255 family)
MTGFARAEGADGDFHWTWEIRSVNGRNLDIRCRLPPGMDSLDPAVRAAVPERCRRGNVSVLLSVTRGAAPPRIRVNREVLDQLAAVIEELRARMPAASPNPEALLAVRGVVDVIEEEEAEDLRERRMALLTESLGRALDSLRAMRMEEGDRLVALIGRQLDDIDGLRRAAGACAALQPDALRARLRQQLHTLLEGVASLGEERLAQEAALLVARGDVREELDRLGAHVEAGRALLANGGAVGRKLDFLCQEFNREANTLCSKSTDVELTRIGLDLKAAIEQMREQVQNIE